MARLLVGNDFNEDLRDDRVFAGWWVQRLLWFAIDDDVLVLPEEPDEFFVDYVTALTGTKRSSLRVVVPPPGRAGAGLLTADRLANEEFLAKLGEAIADRHIDSVFPLWPDASVAWLARDLGLVRFPGQGFLDQGGGALVNSKPVFRAIAGGVDVPLPEGGVFTNQHDAEHAIAKLLELGDPVILKQEYLSGGRGNVILSPVEGVRPLGARQVVLVPGRDELSAYLAENWAAVTTAGRSPLVVERYYRDSAAVFAEFLLTDDGIRFSGQGEMLPSSYAVGEIMPAPWLTPSALAELIEGGRRLCEPVHAMGYRGFLSADAIVTPDGEILYTEYNGRVTGSTHIYRVVGEQLVSENYAQDRILLERAGWSVQSCRAAADALERAGLAYDRSKRTGVVLLNAFDPQYDAIMYCVVAENLDAALEIERSVLALS